MRSALAQRSGGGRHAAVCHAGVFLSVTLVLRLLAEAAGFCARVGAEAAGTGRAASAQRVPRAAHAHKVLALVARALQWLLAHQPLSGDLSSLRAAALASASPAGQPPNVDRDVLIAAAAAALSARAAVGAALVQLMPQLRAALPAEQQSALSLHAVAGQPPASAVVVMDEDGDGLQALLGESGGSVGPAVQAAVAHVAGLLRVAPVAASACPPRSIAGAASEVPPRVLEALDDQDPTLPDAALREAAPPTAQLELRAAVESVLLHGTLCAAGALAGDLPAHALLPPAPASAPRAGKRNVTGGELACGAAQAAQKRPRLVEPTQLRGSRPAS